MSLWQRIRSWFSWQPPVVGSAEGFLLRLGLAAAIWFFYLQVNPIFTRQTHPNGLAEWFDFTFLADTGTWQLLRGIAGVALVFYVAGFAVPISLGYVLWLMVAYGTLRNSQGNIHHGSQALTTVVLAQWIAYLIVAVRDFRDRTLPAGGKWSWLSLFGNVHAHSKAYFYSQQAVVAGYVCAGIAKIGKGKPFWSLGMHWVEQLPHMSVMVTRNGIQHFYDEPAGAGAALLEHGERVGRLIAEHPTLTKLLVGPGLYVELFIVFALCNRRLAVCFGVGLLVMHWMIAYIMQLRFLLNECVILLFFLNVAFLLVAVIEKVSGGRWHLLPEQKLPVR